MERKKLDIVVVDDEPIIRMDIVAMLKNAGYNVIGQGSDGFDAIDLCKELMPDVILLDIQMENLDGLSAARVIGEECPNTAIIMLTAFSNGEYIDKAKENKISCYLLKPINADDVRRALEKLRRLTSGERLDYGSRVRSLAAQRQEEVFLVRVRDRIIPLQRDRIAYCYTSNEKVTACGFDGETYPLDKTLEALQGLLPESEFFRANRQFIVARQAVKEIAVWFGSRLTLHLTVETPERIVISKARVPEFKAWLRSLHPVE